MLVTQQRSSVRELANKLKDVHVGAAPQKKKGRQPRDKDPYSNVLLFRTPKSLSACILKVLD